MADLVFPPGFLWGTAVAAHQVEGGNENDWTRWEQTPGNITDGSVSGAAVDHYHRYREDIAQVAADGHTSFRFSIEWARIEPVDGQFDRAAIAHYADVIATCRKHNVEPMVTLQHFTLPQWLADRGGLLSRDAAPLFERYSRRMAQEYGGDVRWWMTVNEPNVLAELAYQQGMFPPGQRSLLGALNALSALVKIHAAGSRAVHDVAVQNGREALVSFAHHERPIRPIDPRSLPDGAAALLPHYLFNRAFLDACKDERLGPPLGLFRPVRGARTDYLALNYYCDQMVSFDISKPGTLFARDRGTLCMPWEQEPPALTRVLIDLWNRYKLPILISENGLDDATDAKRGRYLIESIRAVHMAIEAGVQVRGYTHWSTMDNFEWSSGYKPKFGLASVDRTSMKRTPRPSAAIFSAIARGNRVTEAMLRSAGLDPARPRPSRAATPQPPSGQRTRWGGPHDSGPEVAA